MLKIERQFVIFIKCKDSVVGDIVIPALFKNIYYSLFKLQWNVFRSTENGLLQTKENSHLSKRDLTFLA